VPVLQEALAAARTIQGERDRTSTLAQLAPYLAQFPLSNLYLLWQETLPILATCTRGDFLAKLGALELVVSILGGEQALTETLCAIQDVGRWWP
jgi:hypothetical protein